MTQTTTIDTLGYLTEIAHRYGYESLTDRLHAAMDVIWRADGEADSVVVHACLSHLQDALSDLISFGEAWDQ